MSELEEKLGAILNNPQMMQQILSLAQTMGGIEQPREEPKKPENAPQAIPNLDPNLLKSLAGLTQKNHVDQNQQALLQALTPYLSRDRVSKLERAMRAARMAGMASSFLNAGGLQLLTGR